MLRIISYSVTLTLTSLIFSRIFAPAAAQHVAPAGITSTHIAPASHSRNIPRVERGPAYMSSDTADVSDEGIPKGTVGAVIGGVLGGVAGYYLIYGGCEVAVCNATKVVVVGALSGAVLGFGLEWLVRPWH